MDELFTVKVFEESKQNEKDGSESQVQPAATIEKFQNMMSARIIKGRMLELEHSDLAGPAVKFKTVVNYERTLKPGSYLGVSFERQDGYITQD